MQYEISMLDERTADIHKEEILKLMKQLVQKHQHTKQSQYCELKYNDMLQFLEDNTAVVPAAFIDDKLIAYAWGYTRDVMNVERMHVTQIVVEDSYKGYGIGKALLETLQKCAVKEGCKIIELNVYSDNGYARTFYEKNGFMCESMYLKKELSEGIV